MESTAMFFQKAAMALEQLSRLLIPLEPLGLDVDEGSQGLKVSMPTGQILLINLHPPLEQIWVSSPLDGGRHFVYQEGSWVDTRPPHEELTCFVTKVCQKFTFLAGTSGSA